MAATHPLCSRGGAAAARHFLYCGGALNVAQEVAHRYKAFPPQMRTLGIWQMDAGLAFLSRVQMDPGFWETPPGPAGFCRVVIQMRDLVFSVKFNGKLRYEGHYGAGSVHISRADEQVAAHGFGPYRFLEACFTQDYLEDS